MLFFQAPDPPLTEKVITVEGLAELENTLELLIYTNEIFVVHRNLLIDALYDNLENWAIEHASFDLQLCLRVAHVESLHLL